MAHPLAEIAAAITAAAGAAGHVETAPPMRVGAVVAPPPGYTEFCRRSPLQCGTDVIDVLQAAAEADINRSHLGPAPSLTATVTPPAPGGKADPSRALTPSRWRQLVTINSKINRSLRAQADKITWGIDDYWAAPSEAGVSAGDCEDYVLEKRKALLKAGFAAADLNIALVSTPAGEAHAVLLVATREGEFVLDNLSPWVAPWNVTSYTWRLRQVDGQAFSWAEVG